MQFELKTRSLDQRRAETRQSRRRWHETKTVVVSEASSAATTSDVAVVASSAASGVVAWLPVSLRRRANVYWSPPRRSRHRRARVLLALSAVEMQLTSRAGARAGACSVAHHVKHCHVTTPCRRGGASAEAQLHRLA